VQHIVSEILKKNNRRLASAWALKGKVEQAMGQLDQARTSLHRALAHDPELSEVRFQLAQVYFDLRQPQRSLSVLDGLLRRFGPTEQPASYLLLDARALAEIGQLDQAAEVLAKASDGPEPMPEMLLELSRIQLLRGDAANARRTLSRGRELFGSQPEFQRRLDELPPAGAETAGVNHWQ
jgi:tetratricopeptide (TPR) repeat protein